MRPNSIRKAEAFTRIELMVVIAVILLLVVLSMPRPHAYTRSNRISCVNNLKQIGLAYRIWSNDNGDHFPASQSVILGGWRDFLTNANQGFLCWTNYSIMQNEMGQGSKLLICPSDERHPAATFSNFLSNTNLSYFVGVSADDAKGQWLLGGDRNLAAGTKPKSDYGFSPENGQGNDVAVQTNSEAGPVSWSLKIHSAGNSAGAGNILLADGSAQQVTSKSFRANWQPIAGLTTNWPAVDRPSSPSIRVLFP